MQRRLEELFGVELELRIGVNTGEVVVGRAREGSSFVTGDAVNVAARLEQAADSGDILVGERTVALAAGAFEFGPLRKSRRRACRRAWIAAGSSARSRSCAPAAFRGPPPAFVGRDESSGACGSVRARSSRPARARDDRGGGRRREDAPVRELWASLGAEAPEPLRRTGRCPPTATHDLPAVAEILKEQFGILDSDPPGARTGTSGQREILA